MSDKEQVLNSEQVPEQPEQKPEQKPVLQPGEKVFAVVLLIFGLITLALSWQLWGKIRGPKVSSAAALPLFASGVWVILALITLLQDLRLTSPLSKIKSFAEKIKQGIAFAFPIDMLVELVLVLGYCVLLSMNVSFYVATPLFLYISMCYLMPKGIKNFVLNIVWTALVMGFIILVFRYLFGVIFP